MSSNNGNSPNNNANNSNTNNINNSNNSNNNANTNIVNNTTFTLRDAVIRGHKVDVLRHLDSKPSAVNEKDNDEVTLLMEAAANNHINIAAILLERKAEVNHVNRLGRTALMEAACRGHPAITLRLCQAKPSLNYVNEKHPLNFNSLMEAASRGHASTCFWLCEAKADINSTSRWGDTPLIIAAHNNRYDTVKVLVAQGAKLDIEGDNHKTALQTAAERGNTRIVEFLSDPRIQSPQYTAHLCHELKQQQKAVLQSEVNYDASILSRTFDPFPQPESFPQFREDLIPITIPGAAVTSLIGQDVSMEKPDTHTYPTQPQQYNPRDYIPRTQPFKTLPKFGYTHWLAIQPRRDSRGSRTQRMEQHNETMMKAEFPVLTLFDNGTWTYNNDQVSGDLVGHFEIFTVLTHGTVGNLTNLDQISETLAPKRRENTQNEVEGKVGTNASGKAAHNILAPNEGTTPKDGEKSSNEGRIVPQYNINYQHIYCIKLTTGGCRDDHGFNTPLQVVECYLGKQVVLGQLVMEMNEGEGLLWWLYKHKNEQDDNGDDDDGHEMYSTKQNHHDDDHNDITQHFNAMSVSK